MRQEPSTTPYAPPTAADASSSAGDHQATGQAQRPHAPAPASLAKGALAGALAGVAGSVAIALAVKGLEKLGPAPIREEASQRSREMDAARIEMADRVAQVTTGRPVPDAREKPVSMAVHLATGAFAGAAYGAAAELDERVTLGHGTAFGAVFYVAAHGAALPALGLVPPPTRTPLKEQAESLGFHMFYGAVAETVREPVRRALG